jgi:hypothetical protein
VSVHLSQFAIPTAGTAGTKLLPDERHGC